MSASKIGDFTVLKKLGDGAYSSVYKVKRLDDPEEYALKKVKMLNLTEKEKENALNEVRILASIDHPNVIGFKEAFIDESTSSLCLVMEYADNGDVFQKICSYQKRETYVKEKKIWYIFI
jgi:NIMA (never in mitosis gene a)-related kinase